MASVAVERAAVVAEALSWCRTPFHHAARVKGAGVDCAQLVLAVYCGLGLVPEPSLDAYPADWFRHQDRERFLEAIAPHCVLVERADLGDLALFKYGRTVSHAAIVVETERNLRVVHSYRMRGVVIDSMAPGTHLGMRCAGVWTLRRWASDRAEATCPA